MRSIKYKNGFTIAELMVAMMIIAGLAMIMMPILYKDTKKQVLEASLQKTYTQLGQATQAISLMQARGQLPINIISSEDLGNAFISALKTSNKLLPSTKKVAYFKDYNTAQNENGKNIFEEETTTVLKNGVCITITQGDLAEGFLNGYTLGKEIIVDINGKKGPNKVGDDIFYFSILKDSSNITIKPKYGENCDDNTCAAAKILGE